MIQSTFNVQLDIKDFWSMKFHLSWFLVNISIFISLSKDIVLLRSNYKLYKLLFFNLMHFQYVLKCKGGLESIIADSIVMQGCFLQRTSMSWLWLCGQNKSFGNCIRLLFLWLPFIVCRRSTSSHSKAVLSH